jgi:8-oxo-dGTP pyrophosphatase MutT (NUDIX family)
MPGTVVNEPTPAATVVPMRSGAAGLEVLLLRRSDRGPFGGVWVFPGGQVEPADRPTVIAEPSQQELEVLTARRAAVREAREEAALDLDEAALVVLSFWVPPPEVPRRFATWFFLAAADGEIAVDRHEIHEHRWFHPAGAIAAFNAREIDLVSPTFMTLWWLSHHANVESALSAARSRTPERFAGRFGPRSGDELPAVLWEGDAGYATADLDAVGSRRRLIREPGNWRVEIALAADPS